MNRPLLLTLALLLFPMPTFAQGVSEIVKDSVYFTMDDGIQDKEEMEEEADYLFGLCKGNAYQALYFDCECLAGAFLQQREKLGPTTPQQDIMYRLTKSGNATCANSAAIAGEGYKNCLEYTATARELASDNEELCTCVGNKTAKDFAKRPRFDIGYIRKMKQGAMRYCLRPENRAAVSKPKN